MYLLKILIFQILLLFNFSKPDHNNPFPRTGPQDLLVTHYDCKVNEQKTLHKYAKNQVTQCESEPISIERTNVKPTLYSKARATTLTGYKNFTIYNGKSRCIHTLRST